MTLVLSACSISLRKGGCGYGEAEKEESSEEEKSREEEKEKSEEESQEESDEEAQTQKEVRHDEHVVSGRL